ncbi:MAG: hypothetical protein ACRBFS_09015 [Aureispira sp.]
MNAIQKEAIIEKITGILKEIPTSIDLVKKGRKEHQRFQYLARYIINKALKKKALLISQDGNGFAVLFRMRPQENNFWKDIWGELGLVFRVTGLKKAQSLLQNQRYIKRQRPSQEEYLYCSFWGIVKGTPTSTAREMKEEFLSLSKTTQLPIYAETRMRKNALVYQRYGFKVFHEWQRPDGETAYFLKYTPPVEE